MEQNRNDKRESDILQMLGGDFSQESLERVERKVEEGSYGGIAMGLLLTAIGAGANYVLLHLKSNSSILNYTLDSLLGLVDFAGVCGIAEILTNSFGELKAFNRVKNKLQNIYSETKLGEGI